MNKFILIKKKDRFKLTIPSDVSGYVNINIFFDEVAFRRLLKKGQALLNEK